MSLHTSTNRLAHLLLWLMLATCAAPSLATAHDAVIDISQVKEVTEALALDESPSFGKADAPVTLIAFSDYQCPFCQRSEETLVELKKRYGDDLRIVRKHLPLAFHKEAEPAARAAVAAHEQGKFELMHHKLFSRQEAFKKVDDIDEYMVELARFIGLDEDQFKKDYTAKSTREQVERDLALAEKLGARGTPNFFVNGIQITGAQSLSKFEEAINGELAIIEALGKKAPANIHTSRFETNFMMVLTERAEKDAAVAKADAVVKHVPVEKSDPVYGNRAEALVTLVVFSDFECPFCQKASVTVQSLQKHYGKKELRIVFKHLPLAFHKQAEPAARAAVAAHKQGAFWAMHDQLFYDQRGLKDADPEYFIGLANKLDLDITQFEKDFGSKSTKKKVATDMELAKELGVRGTPNFFVNGIKITGAQPEDVFKEAIDDQLELAKAMQKKDKKLKGEKLYEALVEHNTTHPVAYKGSAKKPVKRGRARVDARDERLSEKQLDQLRAAPSSTVLGDPEKAKVVIYEFTDLQCPYCKKADATMLELRDSYGEDLAVVSFHFPLVFHKQARPAARAVVAAGEQGKAHAMRELIFEGQKDLKTTSDLDGLFVRYASKLGIDTAQFKKDYAAKATKEKVEQDIELGTDLGVRGTPNFFIEGVRITGAQPTSKFEAAIDEALAGK